jgi:hypothetical protein
VPIYTIIHSLPHAKRTTTVQMATRSRESSRSAPFFLGGAIMAMYSVAIAAPVEDAPTLRNASSRTIQIKHTRTLTRIFTYGQ